MCCSKTTTHFTSAHTPRERASSHLNMAVTHLLPLLALVAVAAGLAIPQPKCHMPQQWEARVVRFDPNRRYYHNHTSEYRAYGRYAYDGDQQRKAWVEDLEYGNEHTEVRLSVLELFSEKKAYVTDLKTQECKIYPLENADWHPHDIPENATFHGFENIGGPADYVSLQQWHVHPDRHGGFAYKTYTQQCVPVRSDHFNNATGFHFEEFSDVTIGIHDPSIWFPPTNCKAVATLDLAFADI
eukprot:m.15813 g.15813  ORF g.15813 m.15813 type:complete len:241 (+) comp5095_c0_seq1:78-800(+)